MIRSILVVCLGNRCRSPMAESLLRRALPNCRVRSAGLDPPVGATADPRAASLLAMEGCTLESHRAVTVDESLIAVSDLVLVMDNEQRDELERLYPQARGKTYRLCEFSHVDVPDPYGGSQGMFVLVLGLIKQGVESWSAHIQAITPANSYGKAS